MKTVLIRSLFLMFFYSCAKNEGTSTGNPLINLNMAGSQQSAVAKFNLHQLWWLMNSANAYAPPASLQDRTGATVSLSDFWINISEIELKTEEAAGAGEVNGSDVQFVGPYLVNLFSASPQKLASGTVTNSSIRRIKYKTKKVSDVSGGNPSGMINSTLYLKGTVGGRNFSFISSQELVFETSGAKLVSFNSGDNLLLEVLTADIIRKINLSQVANNMVISDSNKVNTANACPDVDASASDVYTCFIKAFQKQTKLGKDSDGDFDLESGEDSVN